MRKSVFVEFTSTFCSKDDIVPLSSRPDGYRAQMVPSRCLNGVSRTKNHDNENITVKPTRNIVI